jgi:serine protease Do
MRRYLLLGFILVLVSAVAWGESLSDSISDIVERCSPAVVKVLVEGKGKPQPNPPEFFKDPFFEWFFDKKGKNVPKHRDELRIFRTKSLGAGFLIDGEGHIVTAHRLVEKAERIKVSLTDGDELKAEVVGWDDVSGVAVLKVDADKVGHIRPLELSDSISLRVGQFVLALGYPRGLDLSASIGIVSGLDRNIGEFSGLIQTDALIQPGMGGGPLLNLEGKVIGMNLILFAEEFDGRFGFAVPAKSIKRVSSSLIQSGTVRRGFLGVYMSPVDRDLAKKLKLKGRRGVLITQVMPNTPAEKAGFKKGDVIVEVDGIKVKNPNQFRNLILNTEPGTELHMKVIREGKEMELTVEVGERTEEAEIPELFTWRGISLQDLTDELAERFGYKGEEGALVANVKPGSPGDEAGIKPGDLITEVEREPIKSVDQFREKVEELEGDVLLHLRRGKGALFIVVKPGTER